MLETSIGVFSSREIATGIWLGAFLVWALSRDGVRQSLGGLFASALHPKIVAPVLVLASYVAAVVWGLSAIGLWEVQLLKDTVVWFLFSGLVFAFSGVTTGSKQKPFRQVVREQISLLIPLEFLINAYTFSLPVELVLIPVLVFMAMVDVVSKYKGDFDRARWAATGFQAISGWVMLTLVLARFVGDLGTLQWTDTLREIALPPILTVCILPAVFLFLLLARYETLFIRIGLGSDLENGVRWRARWRLFRRLGLNPSKIDAFLRGRAWALMRIRTRSDLDEVLPPSA